MKSKNYRIVSGEVLILNLLLEMLLTVEIVSIGGIYFLRFKYMIVLYICKHDFMCITGKK